MGALGLLPPPVKLRPHPHVFICSPSMPCGILAALSHRTIWQRTGTGSYSSRKQSRPIGTRGCFPRSPRSSCIPSRQCLVWPVSTIACCAWQTLFGKISIRLPVPNLFGFGCNTDYGRAEETPREAEARKAMEECIRLCNLPRLFEAPHVQQVPTCVAIQKEPRAVCILA